jgi:hypothetical protein
MKRTELKNTTALVKAILEEDQRARNSDSFLYFKVLGKVGKEKGLDLDYVSVTVFLLNMAEWGFPPFESVRRSRQKIQERYPELAASREVAYQRAENEQVFRQFAREGA